MSDINIQVNFPIDDQGFFRRECPYCNREFKIHAEQNDLQDVQSKLIESYLVDNSNNERENSSDEDIEQLYCPYCGQSAIPQAWWTQDQLKYSRTFIQNIMNEMINKQLIQPMKKRTQNSKILSFKGKELRQNQAWIAPEVDDMQVQHLECCDKDIKLLDDYSRDFYCFLCGFNHKFKNGV